MRCSSSVHDRSLHCRAMKTFHRRTWAALIGASLFCGALAIADEDRDEQPAEKSNNAYAIGLWGDLPYSDVQAAAIPALLADMNSQKLAFTVNDGDLKQ